jgi:hypothetical protein
MEDEFYCHFSGVREWLRHLKNKCSKPSFVAGIRTSKEACSVNPRCTNSLLYGFNVDTGTWPWKVKVNKEQNRHYIVVSNIIRCRPLSI